MRLFEIMLPQRDNADRFYKTALRGFEDLALQKIGGFTKLPPVSGQWRNPETGKIFNDEMVIYRLACSLPDFLQLRRAAFVLFPDQEAIMTAEIGTAEIVLRDQPIKEKLTVVT